MAKFNGFKTNFKGLSDSEVRQLQARYGKNELVPEKKATFLTKILGIFKEPMFLLLFCTAMLYFILGEPRDGIIMICFVAFMSGISMFQEWKTDKTLQALKDLSSPKVKVIRNDDIQIIDSRELTVGDLVILEEGEKISADGQIVEQYDLGVDESTLTGESEVVWKTAEASDQEKKANWRRDYCYAGTMVTQGSAVIRIEKTGLNTEYGKIGQDIASVPDRPTPLEKQTRYLIKVCALIGLGLFILVFFITYQHLGDIIESLLSGITLAMAMIPEEFPVILTVFLAMGAWRLARKNALIRRMPSVETLGAVSVLCVDKTGTLTKNQMTVQETFQYGDTSEKELMYWAGLGCETEPYDPMEKAILAHAEVLEIDRTALFANDLIHEYPFSSETKMMGHVWCVDGSPVLAAKGSPESILSLCSLTEDDRRGLEKTQEALAKKGFRVIAVAFKKQLTEIPPELAGNKLDLAGLIGLADPPREAVPNAIRVCSQAGIRVVMITGDNGITAASIAEKIGIPGCCNVITGHELEEMTDEELIQRVKVTNIFARVIPRHKMRIVRALKESGEIVAMTGDGVNDAPALKYSDIGIAMGKRGTGVAREAADMILLDDNFTTIVDTVKDGRRIYDNIKKAIGYVFVIHIPIALTALLTPLLHLPLLLMPIHVVLLELIIDPTCSIVFERQPAEKDTMQRKPRNPGESLISLKLMSKALLQGLTIFAGAFGTYAYMINSGYSQELARTFAVVILMFANIFLVYVNQSEKDSVLSGLVKFLKDKVMWYINCGIIAAAAIIIYLPAANTVVGTKPLGLLQFLCAVGIAAGATLWWELVKLVIRVRAALILRGTTEHIHQG